MQSMQSPLRLDGSACCGFCLSLLVKEPCPTLCYHMNCSDWFQLMCLRLWGSEVKRSLGRKWEKVGYSECPNVLAEQY